MTKLDLYYANQHFVYNDAIVSTSLAKTIAIQYMCEHLTVAPLAFLLDRLLTTDGGMLLELYQTNKDVLSSNITLYFFVPFIFAFLMLLRPIAQYTYTFHISPGDQRRLHIVSYLAAFFGYFIYVESASFLDLKDLLAFLGMAYLIPYTQEQLEEQWKTKQNA